MAFWFDLDEFFRKADIFGQGHFAFVVGLASLFSFGLGEKEGCDDYGEECSDEETVHGYDGKTPRWINHREVSGYERQLR